MDRAGAVRLTQVGPGDAALPASDQRARRVGIAADIGTVEDDGDRLFADAFDGDPADEWRPAD